MRIRLGLWLAALFLLAFSSAAADGATRALLIGADQFVSLPPTAPAAEQNLIRMEQLLWNRWPGMTACRTVLNGPGSAEGLQTLLQEVFAGADEKDTALLYCSTHGLRTREGQAALLLSDGREEEPLTAEALASLLAALPGRKVLILDACYSGGLIGKGEDGGKNPFLGTDTLVLTSAGGREESALWMDEGSGAGGSWFLAALEAVVEGGAGPGDADGDGFFSLRELRESLRSLCGDSRACSWPEDSAAPLFSVGEKNPDRPLSNLRFQSAREEGLSRPKTELTFSAGAPFRLWYRLVYWKNGAWDFENAVQLPDRERSGGIRGSLEPGEKQRTIRLTTVDGEDSGFALLQLMTVGEEGAAAAGSRRIALTGDREIQLRLTCGDAFSPEKGEELKATLEADGPCAVTVTVENEAGELLRTLCTEEPCLPLPGESGGAWLELCWSGLMDDGRPAEPGSCRLHAVWEDALGAREVFSPSFERTDDRAAGA
ncbi:MAG: caspase family protein [Clostridia bacterium]|nr:caspase family protein [Clostridia bacterium]